MSAPRDIHRKAKALWCLPLRIRDDDQFAMLWLDYYQKWHRAADWEDRFEWFIDKLVSTEDLNQAQMAEFLTHFKDYYGYDMGVELMDPDERGWGNLLEHEERAHG